MHLHRVDHMVLFTSGHPTACAFHPHVHAYLLIDPAAHGTTGWIAFGVALGILGLTGVAQRDRGRGIVQSALDVVVLPLAAWSAIASVVFHGSTLTWLSFGDALGFVGLGIVGLIAHELSTERVVHSLAPARSSESAMQAAA